MEQSLNKLSHLIGTLAEQKADIPHYSEAEVNSLLMRLWQRPWEDQDASGTQVKWVVLESLKNDNLSAENISQIVTKLINEDTHPVLRRRSVFLRVLNHPRVSKNTFLQVLICCFARVYWLDEEWHMNPREEWQGEIKQALLLHLPGVKQVWQADKVRTGGFKIFLLEFFKYYDTLVGDQSGEEIITALRLLINKLGPQRIKKLADNWSTTYGPVPPPWENVYGVVESIFLEKFNLLKYSAGHPY